MQGSTDHRNESRATHQTLDPHGTCARLLTLAATHAKLDPRSRPSCHIPSFNLTKNKNKTSWPGPAQPHPALPKRPPCQPGLDPSPGQSHGATLVHAKLHECPDENACSKCSHAPFFHPILRSWWPLGSQHPSSGGRVPQDLSSWSLASSSMPI